MSDNLKRLHHGFFEPYIFSLPKDFEGILKTKRIWEKDLQAPFNEKGYSPGFLYEDNMRWREDNDKWSIGDGLWGYHLYKKNGQLSVHKVYSGHATVLLFSYGFTIPSILTVLSLALYSQPEEIALPIGAIALVLAIIIPIIALIARIFQIRHRGEMEYANEQMRIDETNRQIETRKRKEEEQIKSQAEKKRKEEETEKIVAEQNKKLLKIQEEETLKQKRDKVNQWISAHNITLKIFENNILDQMDSVYGRYNKLVDDGSFLTKQKELQKRKDELIEIRKEFSEISSRKGTMAEHARQRIELLDKAFIEFDTQNSVLEYLEERRQRMIMMIDGCLPDIVKDFEDFFRMQTLDSKLGRTISDSESEKFFERIEAENLDIKNTMDQCDLRIMLFSKSIKGDTSAIDELEKDLAKKDSKEMLKLIEDAKKYHEQEKEAVRLSDKFMVLGMSEKIADRSARLVVFGKYPENEITKMYFDGKTNVKDLLKFLGEKLENEKDCYIKSQIYQIIGNLSRDVSDIEQVERLVKVQRHE
jgi:hypothetical protein